MPLYDVQCRKCGATREVLHRGTGVVVEFCRECDSPAPMRVLPSAPAGFDLKGEGFYSNDYRGKQ